MVEKKEKNEKGKISETSKIPKKGQKMNPAGHPLRYP